MAEARKSLIARPQTPSFAEGRHAGVLLPLFSCPSTRSWGIGEITDLPIVARWLRSAGLDLIQMLPVNEMAFGQTSPYSALSAMAIDPLYISLDGVPEFQMLGGEASLSPETRARLDAVRRSPGVAYAEVRSLKDDALRATYAKFVEMGRHRAQGGRPRVEAFEKFRTESRWWLEDYALFRALHERHEHRAWWTWDPALQAREPAALDRARAELAGRDPLLRVPAVARRGSVARGARGERAGRVLWRSPVHGRRGQRRRVGESGDVRARFVGGHAAGCVQRDRSGLGPARVSLGGRRRREFPLAARPRPPRARTVRRLPRRSRHRLLSHLRPSDPAARARPGTRAAPAPSPLVEPGDAAAAVSKAFFTPAEEHHQRGLGEHIIGVFRESGAYIIAEDLGTVPDFVRESLERLQVPGYRVLRWEREWHQPGQPFRDPAHYPARSLATTGTHDTDPLAIAWDDAPPDERHAIAVLAGLSGQAESGQPRVPPRSRIRQRRTRRRC